MPFVFVLLILWGMAFGAGGISDKTHASATSDALTVVHLGNGYVDVAVDLDGDDGNFEEGGDPSGTGSYVKLTFSYPGAGWTEWMIFYVDSVWAKTQAEHVGDMSPVMPPSDTQYVSAADSMAVVEWRNWNGVKIRVSFRPVSLGTSPGEVEQIEYRIVMKPVDGYTHTCGAMIYFDTMINTNDGAPISTSYGYNANASIFYAPDIPTIWRAYEGSYPPAPGDLRALGILVGYEATMPDVFWYGQCWAPVYSLDFGWDEGDWASATGSVYDDSSVMLKWRERPVDYGDSLVFVTYYGIGTFDTTRVTIIHEPPSFSYDCDGTMNPDTVHFTFMVVNGGTDSVCNVQAQLSGPGFIVVSTENPIDIGNLAGYGGSYNIDWGVLFDPSVWGTTQTYTFTVTFDNCSGTPYTIDTSFSVYIPHPSDLDAEVFADDTILCAGDSVQLHATVTGAVGPITYFWAPDEYISDPNSLEPWVYPQYTTSYIFFVTDSNGCSVNEAVYLTVSNMDVDAGADTVVCFGDSVRLGGSPTVYGGVGEYSYSWEPSYGLSDPAAPNPYASPDTSTTYVLTVTDEAGCSASDTVFVSVASEPYAYFVLPEPCGGVTSCNPPQFSIVVADSTNPIDETSFEVEINGEIYDASSGALTYSDSVLTVAPPGVFATGETVAVVLTGYANSAGCSGDFVACTVVVDAQPPQAEMIYPTPGSTVYDPEPEVRIIVTDAPAGVDTTSFEHISISIGGVPVGGFAWTWSDSTLLISGLSFATGGTVHVCLDSLFDQPDYPYCPPNDTAICFTFVVTLGRVVAYPEEPLDGQITACADQIIRIHLEGTTSPVDEGSIALWIDGASYTIDSPEVSYDSATGVLVFDPGAPLWSDGDTVCVKLWATDVYGGTMEDTLRFCFIVDLSPPYLYDASPAEGDVVTSLEPSFSFGIGDSVSGVDSLVVVVDDSIRLSVDSPCVSWDGTFFSFDAACAGISYPPDETVDVCVTAWDSPDLCGPNELDSCWSFVVTRLCSLRADAGADTSICAGAVITLGGTPAATAGTPPYSYQWSTVGGGVFSTEEHPTVSPSAPTYYVLVVVDALGCSDADTVFVDVHDCSGPVASFVHPTGGFTSCDPESVVVMLTDPDGVDEGSIVLAVNGVNYTTSDPQLYYSDPYLVFVPSPMWLDGDSISVALVSASDVLGNPMDAPPAPITFVVDLSPPAVVNTTPPAGAVITAPSTPIVITVVDSVSGPDSTSVVVEVGAASYGYGDPCLSTAPAYCPNCIAVSVDSSCVELSGCDTVVVRLVVTDTTDFCADNVLDTSFVFFTDCEPPQAELLEPIESAWVSCPDESIVVNLVDVAPGVDEGSILISASDGGTYFASASYGDAGLAYDDVSGVLVWHPSPPLPPSGTITVTLSASDLLGNALDASWTFFVDRVAPQIAEFAPGCGDTVAFTSPPVYIVASDVGCGISDVSVTVDGVAYPLVASGDTFRVDPDSLPVFTGGSLVEVCWHVEDCAGDMCAPNSVDTCCSFAVSAGGPVANIHNPDDGAYVACSTFSVAISIVDPDGILPESVAVSTTIDGATHTLPLDSPEITYSIYPDSIALAWTPLSIHDGMTVSVEVTSASDSLFNALAASDVVSFVFDVAPPLVGGLSPAPFDTVAAAAPTICATITDSTSGVDWGGVVVTVDGVDFATSSGAISYDAGTGLICFDPVAAGMSWRGGDSVEVCISAPDSPDTCGPNVTDTCWIFFISRGGPQVAVIRPSGGAVVACQPDSVVWIAADSNGIDTASAGAVIWTNGDSSYIDATSDELRLSTCGAGSVIVVLYLATVAEDGDSVRACLATLSDSLGNDIDSAVCVDFVLDLSPPVFWGEVPAPGETVRTNTPTISVFVADSTSGVDSLSIAISAGDTTFTISDECLSFAESLITLDPALCGVSWSGGSTIDVCVYASDLADTAFCGPNADSACWSFVVAGDAPTVTPIAPTDSSVTSCLPETVVVLLSDPDGVDPSSVVASVNGSTFTLSSAELWLSGDTLYFTPSEPFGDGELVRFCVESASDMLGNAIAAPECFSFFADYSPPLMVLANPAEGSMVRDDQQDITVEITDIPGGVDTSSVIFVVAGDTIPHSALAWGAISGGFAVTFVPESFGTRFADGETVWVSVYAEDTTDFCADNAAQNNWWFMIEPVVGCGRAPNPFTPNADGQNDFVVFDYPNMFSEPAEIHIYDLCGVEVYSARIGPVSDYADFSLRSWDGTDNNGNPLPQGVYIYVISVGGEATCSGTVVIAR